MLCEKQLKEMSKGITEYAKKLEEDKQKVINTVMLSQPMANRTTEEIKKERQLLVDKFKEMNIEVINTFFTEEPPKINNTDVYYLGKAIQEMSKVDALYMCKG